jgi:hypothetical protein
MLEIVAPAAQFHVYRGSNSLVAWKFAASEYFFGNRLELAPELNIENEQVPPALFETDATFLLQLVRPSSDCDRTENVADVEVAGCAPPPHRFDPPKLIHAMLSTRPPHSSSSDPI